MDSTKFEMCTSDTVYSGAMDASQLFAPSWQNGSDTKRSLRASGGLLE